MTPGPPHIGLDLRIADPDGMLRSGLGRYATELAGGLLAARPQWRFSVYSNRDLGLRAQTTRWPTRSAAGRVAWEHVGSWLDLRRDRPDVWVSPAYVTPAWWRGPSVVAVHDLSFLEMPERYRGSLNAWHARTQTARSVKQATRVTCGTHATAQRIADTLGVAGATVIPYGVSDVFRRPAEPSGGYVLYAGTFEARKGLEILLEAMDAVRAQADVDVVLAGSPGWGADAVLAAARERPWVRIVEDPDDTALAGLYARALACAYPSRREGFGLPVAEAMGCGCPVIATDLPEVREWAGDAPLWVPVGDAPALAAAVLSLADDAERGRRSAAGGAIAAGLTWQRTAAGVARLIEESLPA
ncbi:MAG: glycosyltransferase family 1 protein [Solirubrobacteraceae bacterium]